MTNLNKKNMMTAFLKLSLGLLAITAVTPASAIMNGLGQDILPVPVVFYATATIQGGGDDLYSLQTASGIYVLAGNVNAPFFIGNGSLLTGFSKNQVGLDNVKNVDQTNAANITSGVLPLARLSGIDITNAEISGTAAIADTKLATIATSGKVSNSATTADSANTASAIVARDASGNFSAGVVTAALAGNAATATTATTADTANALANSAAAGNSAIAALNSADTGTIGWARINKTNSSLANLATRSAEDLNSGILPLARLSGITSDELSETAQIVDTQLATIKTPNKVWNEATSATDLNTPDAIVTRDASGNFSAGVITAATFNGALNGNANTVTTNANLTGVVTSVGNTTSIDNGAISPLKINGTAAVLGSNTFTGTQTFNSLTVFPESGTTLVADGATLTADRAFMKVAGNGGPAVLNTTTGITAGTSGQVVILMGTSDSNTVKLTSSGNVQLSGDVPYKLKQNATIALLYNGTKWVEMNNGR